MDYLPFGPQIRNKASRIVIVALILFAFAWRIHNLDAQSLWRDETDAIYFALRDLPSTLSMFVDTAQNGALFFLSLRPWLRLMGSSEFILRYPSVIFGVLAIPLLLQVCRRLLPSQKSQPTEVRDTGNRGSERSSQILVFWDLIMGNVPLLAAIFLAINPYHLWYSQDGKMYALITLLALMAVWFWLSGIDRGGWRPWLGFLVVVSIAIYTHLLMILLIPLFFIWFLIAWPQSRRHWRGFLLALIGLSLPYLPLLMWQWDFLTASKQLTAFSFTPLKAMARTLLLFQSNSFLPPRDLVYIIPVIAIVLVATFAGYRTIGAIVANRSIELSSRRSVNLIFSWILVPIATIFFLSLRQPVFLPRYVIWITPAVCILLGLGLYRIWRSSRKRVNFLALAFFAYVVVYWGYIGWQEKTQTIKYDLRSAIRYVYDQRQMDELLILQIPHTDVAYRYYSSEQGSDPFDSGEQRLGWWAPGLSTSFESTVDEAWLQVDRRMHQYTFGASDIWVVFTEEELVDQHLLMEVWLDYHTELVDKQEFHGTRVQHYRFSRPLWEPASQILSLLDSGH